MKNIKITTEFITLGQFLKYVGLISLGSEAKTFLLNEKVLVNGGVENRRGRKLYVGNTISINKTTYTIEK